MFIICKAIFSYSRKYDKIYYRGVISDYKYFIIDYINFIKWCFIC